MTTGWAAALSVGSIVAVLLLPAAQADAHGGKLQLELAPAGPYVVSVWTAPDPARVGALDISASILRSDTRRPVDDAGMRLTARVSTASGFVEGVGSRAAGRFFDLLAPRLYHARVEIPAPGRWHVTVSVLGSAGRGDVDFDMDVAPPLTISWVVIAASAAVSILVLAGWFAVRGRTRRRREARHEATHL
jgi:hypothetical protein